MPLEYEKPVTKSLARQIAEEIRAAILNGDLKTDERLPGEADLAARYGVSRPTVREALKRLAAQNLIRSRRGPTGGTFVTHPSRDEALGTLTNLTTLLVGMGEFDLQDVAEARRHLELVCVQLAARRRDESHLERMRAEVERQADPSVSDAEFCASDVRFHRALVDATGNPVLQFVMASVVEALQPVGNMLIYRFRDRAQVVAQHRTILEAVADQDKVGAQQALIEQMETLAEQYAAAQTLRRQQAGRDG